MILSLLPHWIIALLLVAMGTFALLEKRSASFVSRSLILWPVSGFLLSFMFLSALFVKGPHSFSPSAFLVTGVVLALCSAQALLFNIRKLNRWPSGFIWLGLVLAGFFYQFAGPGSQELSFRIFFGRLSGWIWAAVGIVKVIEEKSVSQEGGAPAWILLLYVQAILIASSPF
ncbi:MAG TPA: hypothetical protein PKL97_06075 [Candidatus Omnitrophota bacterium]|nr:hypothetical protein [Candidatus Omnitrophota bacterium]